MLKNNTKKAIVIKNFSSNLIDEAIIFLKQGVEYDDDTIVSQAEKVISDYVNRQRGSMRHTNKERINRIKKLLFWFSGLICGLISFSLLYFIFLI